MSNGVSPETHFQDKGKPSHEAWLLQVITHDLPAVCTPDTFIKIAKQSVITWYYNPIDRSITKQWHLAIKYNKNLQLYYRNWLDQLWVSCKQHYYAHYTFMLIIITWIPNYHVSLLTQSHTSQQWLVVVSTFLNPKSNYVHSHETLLIRLGSFTR